MRLRIRFLYLLGTWLAAAVLYALLLNGDNSSENPRTNVLESQQDSLLERVENRLYVKSHTNEVILEVLPHQQQPSGKSSPQDAVVNIAEGIYNRALPDTRHPRCLKLGSAFQGMLVSVVISYHNEEWDALVRTVHSVLGRTPSNLLKEVLLVDDNSIEVTDKRSKDLLKLTKVRLLRNEQREGLIRSRDRGARAATGTHLFFLDSHCEVNSGWLEPLLETVQLNPRALVSPVIDVIDGQTLRYRPQTSILKGAFDWGLRFQWLPLSKQEKRKRSAEKTLRTPVIPGGLFLIQKAWFLELGGFDTGLEIWGAENLEMSIKAWLCGGEVLTSPCSRVGHVFRRQHTYTFPMGPANTYAHNARRVVDVWFDEYKRYFYENQASLSSKANPGSLLDRLKIKNSLRCKPFKWLLENVYPELRPPQSREISASGQLKHSELCLDVEKSIIILSSCLLEKQSQEWSLTKDGDLVTSGDRNCLFVTSEQKLAVLSCSGSDGQKKGWSRRRRALLHRPSGLCLSTFDPPEGRTSVILSPCDSSDYGQLWDFSAELQNWR